MIWKTKSCPKIAPPFRSDAVTPRKSNLARTFRTTCIIDIDSEPSWLKEECKSHLKLISSTLEQRIVPVSDDFKDLVVNPLGFNKYEILKEDIKVDLIFLQSNSHVRKAFQGKDYVDFWLSIEEIVSTQYGKLWDIIAPLIITFPTTYSVECAFSSMAFIASRSRCL